MMLQMPYIISSYKRYSLQFNIISAGITLGLQPAGGVFCQYTNYLAVK